jgi:hypothetical protein
MNKRRFYNGIFRVSAAVAFCMMFSCSRGPGPDSDGDGLFDFQEELFKTITGLVDTDSDGILDGVDIDPLSGDPQLKLTMSPAFQDDDGSRCVIVGARLVDGRGNGVKNAAVDFSWGLGDLPDMTTDETGVCRLTVCSADKVETTLEAGTGWTQGTVDVLSATIDLSFKELVVPGVNTAPWEKAGSISGSLKVVVLYRDKWGRLKPFEGASVFVSQGLIAYPFKTTGPEGVIDFVDAALVGPVDVTVGAPGHRYLTYFRVGGAVISIVLDPIDAARDIESTSMGTIEGKVKGFFGEGGLPRFPSGTILSDDFGDGFPIAIVQTAISGRPLSSMSMGSVLESPMTIEGLPIPSNMALCDISDLDVKDCPSIFRLKNVPEGQHLVFALGGIASHVIDALSDPYQLIFKPRALAISRVSVEAGKVTTVNLLMNIDLTQESGESVDIHMGSLPNDWKTGRSMANALVMPVMDTGGEGFIFVAVNGDYNRDGFTNPIKIRFPDEDDPVIKALGLKITRLAVGLAARKSYLGGDPPGISTPVRPGISSDADVHFDTGDVWLEIPKLAHPQVTADDVPLDTVSTDLFDGTISWEPVVSPHTPDLYVVRLNYLTEAPLNWLVESSKDSGVFGTLGGPKSHALWEFFVPSDMTSITLPTFPEGFPTPYLGNPDPTPADSTSPHRFGPKTIEVELSAYILGSDGKEFNYSDNFAYNDVNMHCTVVSQDSVPVNLK